MRGESDDERAERIRRGREVLSGGSVTPPDDPIGYGDRFSVGRLEFRYFLALSILVVLSALVWAIWGMELATPLLVLLALGLLAGWIVL